MKKLLLVAATAMLTSSLFAQDKIKLGAYELSAVVENKASAVPDQHRSSTCWCFATTAMLESDFIKAGKGEHNLSEMWFVRNAYFDKVVRYVRMHGCQNLAGGGAQIDVINAAEKHGIVPESVYSGINYGTENEGHVHAELDRVLNSFANAIIKNANRTLSTAWHNALNGILDAYFGPAPEKFTYNGKEYTPMSFAKELGFNAEDYIYMSSFTHHPYYENFVLEVQDNWEANPVYNVPFDLFQTVIYDVIKNGYTVSWAADLDKGFKHNKGLALYPETDVKQMAGSERARWEQLAADKKKSIYDYDEVVKEKVVTAQEHQTMFDNYDTTDDHGMQLCSIYKDQNGTIFYKTKNSWNTDNSAAEGFLFTSAPYVRAKTTSILFNKKALSAKNIKELKLPANK